MKESLYTGLLYRLDKNRRSLGIAAKGTNDFENAAWNDKRGNASRVFNNLKPNDV
jgi:hypothetical protein